MGLDGQGVEIERPDQQGGGQFLHHVDKHHQGGGEQGTAHQRPVNGAQRGEGATPQAARGFVHRGADFSQARFDRLQGDRQEANQIGKNQRGHRPGEQQARGQAELRGHPAIQLVVKPRERKQHADGDDRSRHGIAKAGDAGGEADQQTGFQAHRIGYQNR